MEFLNQELGKQTKQLTQPFFPICLSHTSLHHPDLFQNQPSLQILISESQNSLLKRKIRPSQASETITTIFVPPPLYHKSHQSSGHFWGMAFGGNHSKQGEQSRRRAEQALFSQNTARDSWHFRGRTSYS